MNSRANHLRPGFTLMELLVLVTIVAILIALLLPALKMAQESANETQCLNNTRSIGSVAMLYAIAQEIASRP